MLFGVRTIFVYLACTLICLPKARAAEEAEAANLRVELRDGAPFTGRLEQQVGLSTSYGSVEIEPAHIRRITFRAPGGDGVDVVELDDQSLRRGRIRGKMLVFRAGEERRSVALENLREIQAIHKPPVGVLAVLLGLVTLTAMEIVLGIDNVIFLAIVAGKLPRQQQPRARRFGLLAALATRILLLLSLSYLLGLTRPLFTLPEMPLLHDAEAREISLRDLVLLAGGIFLIGKSVLEMHSQAEEAAPGAAAASGTPAVPTGFLKAIVQIAVIDIVFSLDSVITAVGMVDELWVMMTAMILAMLVMLVFAGVIGDFVSRHPTLKVLALSFLILIGVMLTAEGLGQHMNKGYIYFAMAFAVVIEIINLRLLRRKYHTT